MKKWMYLVFPGIMLAIFLVLYTTHKKEAEEREKARTAKLAADIELEKQKKKENEERARIDAEKRQKEREEEERKKEAERRRKQEAADKEVRDATAQYRAEADKLAKEAGQLEIELDRLHKEKDQLGRREFDLAKQVELARVAKRNAELQQQHMTAMIAQRAETSAMARMPPPPPAPAK